jgi:hypothetical protein
MSQDWRKNPNLVECFENCAETLRAWASQERAHASFQKLLSDPYGQRQHKAERAQSDAAK